MREPSFFEKAGRRFGDNYRRMLDPNSPGNKRAREARKNVKTAYKDFTSGLKGDATQRSEGGSGGGSGQVADPSATYTGLGSFTAADPGTVTPKKEFDFGGENGDFDTFDTLTRGGNIGLGTKENPFTGTRSRPSGFAPATDEDIALRNENTGGGLYAAGLGGADIARANAAYDLYRGDQMRQVAENDRNSSLHIESIARKNAMDKQDRIRRSAFREGGRMKGLSQRRRAEIAGNANNQLTELAEQGAKRRTATDVREVGLAEANNARFTGQGQVARANADRYVQDSKAGIELMKVAQQDREFGIGRQTSGRDVQEAMTKILSSVGGDNIQMLMKDPDFMGQIRQEAAMLGMEPQAFINMMENEQAGRPLGG